MWESNFQPTKIENASILSFYLKAFFWKQYTHYYLPSHMAGCRFATIPNILEAPITHAQMSHFFPGDKRTHSPRDTGKKLKFHNFQHAHGVVIVFDLSRPETFEGALSWLSDVTQKLFDEKRELAAAEAASVASPNCSAEDSLKANRPMPVILLANKCDLAALKVPRHKYSSYVQENGLLAW